MEWKNVVYGPVKSRRLGQSLGINLSPIELKVCNFSCGYCRVGAPSKGTIKREHLASYFSEHLCRKIREDIIILWDSNTRGSNLPLYPKQINCTESYRKGQISQE